MIETLPKTIQINTFILISLLSITAIFAILSILYFPKFLGWGISRFLSPSNQDFYSKVVAPYQTWLGIILILSLGDIAILTNSPPQWVHFIELPLSLVIAIAIAWIGSRLFLKFFDFYLLDIVTQKRRKVNSELLILAKLLANSIILLVVIFIFAQTHQINLLGLIASLGVGGLAVAFAAQKTLEQFLGGIVLYIDRPFVVDDYIGLPDGTFGRVETIGLRSTKIRTSGKGTLMIIPNNVLTQTNIENFTGAKKVISLIYLNFYRSLPPDEKALIRQVILESTNDIFGIDPRSTEVVFKNIVTNGKGETTQAQVTFFILGSGDVSMDLRRQLLDIATQSINQQLKEYGIDFDISENTVNVDSPITI
ncbi:MAG: mechanosensitive ion channel family protein [Chroococcales cyanobacterium]